jgi:hypothetical protein
MFASKVKSFTKRGETEIVSGLTHKHWTRLEKIASDKHSSLLRTFVNYEFKKFYNIGPWLAEYLKAHA